MSAAIEIVDIAWVSRRTGGRRCARCPGTERRSSRPTSCCSRSGSLGPEPALPRAFGCELDPRGNVRTGLDKMTSVPGVFAAGDCSRGQSLVVWAIREGRAAARGVDRYLMRGETILPA